MLTDARIAANIDRGFCPKNRSAAVVPSGRVRKKWCTAVRHARFLGVIKAASLVVTQREGPVPSFHWGTGTLEDLRERGCLGPQLVLLHRVHCPQ